MDIFDEQYYNGYEFNNLYLKYDCGKIDFESSYDEQQYELDIDYCIEVLHMFYEKYQGKKSYSDYQWRFNDCKITIMNDLSIVFSYKGNKKIKFTINDHPSLHFILSSI